MTGPEILSQDEERELFGHFSLEYGAIQSIIKWLDPRAKGRMLGEQVLKDGKLEWNSLSPAEMADIARGELNTIHEDAPWALLRADYEKLLSVLDGVISGASRDDLLSCRPAMTRIVDELKDVNRRIRRKIVQGMRRWQDIAPAVEAELIVERQKRFASQPAARIANSAGAARTAPVDDELRDLADYILVFGAEVDDPYEPRSASGLVKEFQDKWKRDKVPPPRALAKKQPDTIRKKLTAALEDLENRNPRMVESRRGGSQRRWKFTEAGLTAGENLRNCTE